MKKLFKELYESGSIELDEDGNITISGLSKSDIEIITQKSYMSDFDGELSGHYTNVEDLSVEIFEKLKKDMIDFW